uniref:Putative terminase small subunit n=1 Tax=viral metagenome TaxID=1070528 RepID=A0A6M3L292_9ZZZZ
MAAPKGNQNALGNEGGRPPFYDDPLKLQIACDTYFQDCKRDKTPTTITGLALALGFSTRKSLLDYEDKVEFVNIIKKAKLKVECEYEKRLSGNAPTGAIFALKNMHWQDRQELTGADGKDLNTRITIELIDSPDQVKKEDASSQESL